MVLSSSHLETHLYRSTCARHSVTNITRTHARTHARTHTHTHPFNGPLSGTTRVSQYQKGKTDLDFTGARDSEWQWNPLGHMQVCTSHQTDNHASTPPPSFLHAGCPSCRPTNSVKALKANHTATIHSEKQDNLRQHATELTQLTTNTHTPV